MITGLVFSSRLCSTFMTRGTRVPYSASPFRRLIALDGTPRDCPYSDGPCDIQTRQQVHLGNVVSELQIGSIPLIGEMFIPTVLAFDPTEAI